MIQEETLLIETEGYKVGQINGLTVMTIGDYSFGKPAIEILAQVEASQIYIILCLIWTKILKSYSKYNPKTVFIAYGADLGFTYNKIPETVIQVNTYMTIMVHTKARDRKCTYITPSLEIWIYCHYNR